MQRYLGLVLAFLFAATAAARADTTGTLAGRVVEPSGRPVANAVVTATSPAGISRTKTDAQGYFVFVSIAPATYTLTVERPRYITAVYRGAGVDAGTATSITIAMEMSLRTVSADPGLRIDWFVTPGLVEDRYRVSRHTSPFYDVSDRVTQSFQFVPGITFGAGAPAQY